MMQPLLMHPQPLLLQQLLMQSQPQLLQLQLRQPLWLQLLQLKLQGKRRTLLTSFSFK